MKKLIILMLFAFTQALNSFSAHPVIHNKLTDTELAIINKTKEDPSLILDIKIDDEKITFFATNKVISNDTIYVIGQHKQVKGIAFTNNKLKIILNNKIITIDNIKINENLKEAIYKLPNT